MKGRDSPAFERVLNRTLYSKKIVLAMALAVIMVGSAFVVSVSTMAGTGDPTHIIYGWSLKGGPGWTFSPGVVKGYAEGDVVPIKVTLNNPNPAVASIVQFTIGFEWGKGELATPTCRGFEQVVEYNWYDEVTNTMDDPSPPFNDPIPSSEPFCTDTDSGSVVSTHHSTVPEKYQGQWLDEWDVTFTFVAGVATADVRAGGLLFETTPTQNGASYFP